MRVTRLTPIVLLPLTACIGLLGSSTRSVQAPPSRIVDDARQAFRAYSIPVARADRLAGIVESGRFRVWDGWGGEPIDARVACAGADDRHSLDADSIMLEVELTADHRPARAPGEWHTEVRLRGHGTAYFGDQRLGCRLTRRFADRVLSAAIGSYGVQRIVDVEG